MITNIIFKNSNKNKILPANLIGRLILKFVHGIFL